jgi:HEPN domain-containing protein
MPPDAPWEDLGLHAQQAAELAIKAVYQHQRLTFPFVHDMRRLIIGLQDAGVEVPAAVQQSAKLTRFATHLRYPGVSSAVTEDEFREALGVAEAVVAWARERID